MRIAFVSAEGLVRNVIVAKATDERMMSLFLDQARATSDATEAVEVADDDVPVWIGGRYNEAEGFLPPLPPPVIEVVDGVSEELTLTEGTPDGIAVLE